MKYLFYSDLHLRPERMKECDFVLTEIGKIAVKHRAKLVNGGDTFNTRGLIKTSCFDLLYRRYTEWADMGLEQIINIGNHDQEDLAGEIHPMKVFERFKGWHVIDKPQVIGDIAFFPYMARKKIEEALKTVRAKDAVVHWGIRGAKRNDWNVDTDGVPVEWLEHFRNVFSGHYHYRSRFENVQYIGTPFQQNFAEINQPKGVILYDDKKNEETFIEIEGTPKHYKAQYSFDEKGRGKISDCSQVQAHDHLEVEVEGDIERVTGVSSDSIRKIVKCDNITLKRNAKEKAFSRLKIDAVEVLDPKSLMKKYVDFVDSDLDRTKLMRVGEELVSGI